jgi:hypothetical protein
VLQAPEFRARQARCRTKIALAADLVEAAIRQNGPCGVGVFDAWSLAEEVVRGLARRRKDGSSRRNKNRRLDTASLHRRNANGWAIKLPSSHSAVEALGPLIPAKAYRPVTVSAPTDWCVTLGVHLPGLDQVRIVGSCEHAACTGPSVGLVTNRMDWRAAKILDLDSHRGPTEPCYPDSKGPLGVNASRMRRAEALGTHGCLVFVASALVHLPCLPAVPDRTRGLLRTMGDACRQQGRGRLHRLVVFGHDSFSHGATADHVFAP